MKHVAWVVMTYILLALESPLLDRLDTQLYVPDVTLLLAMFVASRTALVPGLLCVLAAGLLKDGFSLAAPAGLFTEISVLIYLASRGLCQRIDFHSTAPTMATSAVLSLLASGLFVVLESIFHRDFTSSEHVVQMVLPLALISMIMAPVQFALFDRIGNLFGRSRTADTLFHKRQ